MRAKDPRQLRLTLAERIEGSTTYRTLIDGGAPRLKDAKFAGPLKYANGQFYCVSAEIDQPLSSLMKETRTSAFKVQSLGNGEEFLQPSGFEIRSAHAGPVLLGESSSHSRARAGAQQAAQGAGQGRLRRSPAPDRKPGMANPHKAGQDGRTADNGGPGKRHEILLASAWRSAGRTVARSETAREPAAGERRQAAPPQAQIDEANAASGRSTDLYAEQRYAEALPFAERAAVMFAQLLGADHPHVAQMRTNQAAILFRTPAVRRCRAALQTGPGGA